MCARSPSTRNRRAREGFLDRRDGIKAVDLIEIDVIELQPLQAAADLIHDVAARQADVVRARAHAPAHFGGDDHVLALHLEVAQGLAEQDFRLALGIDVGGVDEIDAGFDCSGDERGRALLFDGSDVAPETGAAVERHRAEANLGYELPGPAERLEFHGSVLKFWCRERRPREQV